MIAQPLEFVPAEPFAGFLARLKELIRDKEVELILVGMPRNMDGSYGPAALKVQDFVASAQRRPDRAHQDFGMSGSLRRRQTGC